MLIINYKQGIFSKVLLLVEYFLKNLLIISVTVAKMQYVIINKIDKFRVFLHITVKKFIKVKYTKFCTSYA